MPIWRYTAGFSGSNLGRAFRRYLGGILRRQVRSVVGTIGIGLRSRAPQALWNVSPVADAQTFHTLRPCVPTCLIETRLIRCG